MDDGPTTTWSIDDFGVPRLRKCPFSLGSIDWEHAMILGRGMDGIVWRVYFGDDGPYALKLVGSQSYTCLETKHMGLTLSS